MTLFRQMAYMTSLLLLAILATVMVLNFRTTNAAVQEQLYEDAKNTASSLSLSLGSANGDESIMSTMINANFDSGHYSFIALHDIDDALIYERVSEEKTPGVPQWFVDLVPVATPVASAQVSAGWNPIGILSIQSDNTHAYVQLYETLMELLYSFTLFALIGMGVLYVLLHFMLKPLERVQDQAAAILDNQFIIQEEVPYTTEFKNVVAAMNAMVKKAREVFNKGNEAMKRNHELLYNDAVTKLYNRRYFTLKMLDLLGLENEKGGGTILLIALHGAENANKILGRQSADELFLSLASIFEKYGASYSDRITARVHGTEFAMLLPNCESDEGLTISESIYSEAKALFKLSNLDENSVKITVGLYRYRSNEKMGDVLSRADYALAQANIPENPDTFMHEPNEADHVIGKEAWRHIIESSIANDRIDLTYWPVLDSVQKRFTQYVMTFSLYDNSDNHYPYGTFIAPAIGLGLVPELYNHAIAKLFETNSEMLHTKHCSIRLSADYIKAPSTYKELQNLFEKHARSINFSLTFELPDSIVLQNLELLHSFTALFKKYGFGFGINQFLGESTDFDYLQSLNPRFIKADCAFLLDMPRENMTAMHMLTDTMGIELIATGVRSEEELQQLQTLHITTIQGPLAEKLGALG